VALRRKEFRREIWRQCGGRCTEERYSGTAEEGVSKRDMEAVRRKMCRREIWRQRGGRCTEERYGDPAEKGVLKRYMEVVLRKKYRIGNMEALWRKEYVH
jgi:hypothetical protein